MTITATVEADAKFAWRFVGGYERRMVMQMNVNDVDGPRKGSDHPNSKCHEHEHFIREALAQGMSQASIARAIGVSRSAISKHVRGTSSGIIGKE